MNSPAARKPQRPLRARQSIGKYRIRRRIGEGAFATVYEAYDTIEATYVALKVPHADLLDKEMMDVIRREVRLTAQMDHPNVLPLRNATMHEGRFIIATPLGDQTLADRLQYRLGPRAAMEYATQLIDAIGYAHGARIIHCDIKPDNIILFEEGRLRLADFGIAKVALRTRTIQGSGTGTVGYMAPEQAMGKPSFRSDVFSMGLVLTRMFSGSLPEWPFDWPPTGIDRLRRTLSKDFIDFLRKSTELHERRRFRDGVAMKRAFQKVAPLALRRPSASARVR